MSRLPYHPPKMPQHSAEHHPPNHHQPSGSNALFFWSIIVVVVVSAVVLGGMRLRYQQQQATTEKQVFNLLESAENCLAENRQDDAETAVNKALGILPGDKRCAEMMVRINEKRQMIRQKSAEGDGYILADAERHAGSDINAATEALRVICLNESYSPELHRAASARIEALKGGVCSLKIPDEWPADAILAIDDVVQNTKQSLIGGIKPGKHTISIKRGGYRQMAPIELDFLGTQAVRLPTIKWLPPGAIVFVSSKPDGAAVWRDGKDTGKLTPCKLEDVDDGPIKLILKLNGYGDTPVSGEVIERKPLVLTAPMKP